MQTGHYITNINGHELVLRNAVEDDAETLIIGLKTVCRETGFLLKEPEEITMTPEEERSFIRWQNESETNVSLLGFLDGKYVGNCSLTGNRVNKFRHRASLGIALYQKYTGMGIGRIMIEKLIEIAKKRGLEQIDLEVVAGNERAIALYEKMGFEKYGTFPQNVKYKDGTYADMHWMMKRL